MSEAHERWRLERAQWFGGALTHKCCARCGESLPVESFRVEPCRSKSLPWLQWKLSSWCRDCQRQATRRWREANRERLAEARRTPPSTLTCAECGSVFEGRKSRIVCSRRCKDARYQRLHPEAYREKLRRKDARRRQHEREAGS